MALFTKPQVPMTITAETTRLTAGSSHIQPVSADRDSGRDDAGRDQRVGGHVEERALQIEVALAPRGKEKCGDPIDEYARGSDPDDDAAGHRHRVR